MSDPRVGADFVGHGAALLGSVLALIGFALHDVTGSPVPDAVGAVLVGTVFAGVAIYLIDRSRSFVVGAEIDPRLRNAMLRELLALPEVERVTYLRAEVVGPDMLTIHADIDFSGNEPEESVAYRLRAVEARLASSPGIAGVTLSLSCPDEPSLDPN